LPLARIVSGEVSDMAEVPCTIIVPLTSIVSAASDEAKVPVTPAPVSNANNNDIGYLDIITSKPNVKNNCL
jgi:hypothetical protein